DPTPTGEVVELTDPDGDALTVTTGAQGTWITCTTDGSEGTVGPFPAAVLAKALAASARMAASSGMRACGRRAGAPRGDVLFAPDARTIRYVMMGSCERSFRPAARVHGCTRSPSASRSS